ncbi:MAG: sulfatase-like hydrolase/transferase, partial [Planctomycetota bacterium]
PLGTPTRVENLCEIEAGRPNLARVLQQHGYRTGFVGKSHIIRHEWLHPMKPADSGLKTWSQYADPRDPAVNAAMRHNHRVWCDELKKYGFDYADGVYPANLKELWSDALDVHNLDWTVDRALRFLEESSESPFFLCFSTTLHHGPPPSSTEYSLHADPRMTGEGFVSAGFDALPTREDVLERNRQAGFDDDVAYALWLDDGVGAILDRLAQLGIDDETLVIFASDHGSYRYGKTTLYEHGIRVPAICRWPSVIAAGSRYDGIVSNIDVAPTVLDIAGVEQPTEYQVDGLSLRSVLRGDHAAVRDSLFGELGYARCVKTTEWKYIAVRYPEAVQRKIDRGEKFPAFRDHPPLDRPYLTRNGHLGHNASAANPLYFESDQLFDLVNDPEERTNVIDEYPAIAAQMK